jgi:CheY-like chemotaxis protein
MTASRTASRILIVDDHADTRDCVAHLLRRLGYATVTADCCDAARAAARASEFDAIVGDVGLPDGDGVALMEELKARYGIPCVALTGHVMTHDVCRYQYSNLDAYLAKPTGVSELGRVVANLTSSVVVGPMPRRRSA